MQRLLGGSQHFAHLHQHQCKPDTVMHSLSCFGVSFGLRGLALNGLVLSLNIGIIAAPILALE